MVKLFFVQMMCLLQYKDRCRYMIESLYIRQSIIRILEEKL